MEFVLENATKKVLIFRKTETVGMKITPISRSLTAVIKNINPNEGDIFFFINSYIAECLNEDEKEELFNCYKAIDIITRHDDEMVVVKLSQILADIQRIIDYDRLVVWVLSNKKIKAPESIEKSYNKQKDVEGLMMRDKTYIQDEYKRLCAYVMLSRIAAVAIYGFDTRLVDIFRPETKSLYYFDLLEDTPITTSGEYHKLEAYVKRNRVDSYARNPGQEASFKTMVSLRGIDELDIDRYVMSVIVLNHLSTFPLLETTDGKNLVKKVYRIAVYTINNITADTNKPLRIKRVSDNIAASDDSHSVLENHRATSSISIGTMQELKVYYKDPLEVVRAESGFKVDVNLYNMLVENIPDMGISIEQLSLTNGILANIVRGEILLYIEKDAVIRYLALAATIAYQHGFSSVSKILTSIPDPSDIYTVNTAGNRSRLTDEHRDLLYSIFPYFSGIHTSHKSDTLTGSDVIELLDAYILDTLVNEPRITATSEEINEKIYGDPSRVIKLNDGFREDIINLLGECRNL